MLLDEIMPTYHCNLVHSTFVRAAPGRIFRAIKETRAADIRLFNLIAFLAYFSPQEQEGDHSFIQVQFNETYQYRSNKEDK